MNDRPAGQDITLIHSAGVIALANAVLSAVGVVFLVLMYVRFSTPGQTDSGLTFGRLNDSCVAIQYALTIPIALALYRILAPYNPRLILAATVVGILSMLVVVGLQLALIFEMLTFERQVLPVSLAMIVGVGSWLVITGYVARATERLPHSVLMSWLAVPYLGYPLWAFWLGRRLLNW